MFTRTFLTALALVAVALPARADHDAIDEAFAKASPQILDKLKAKKAKNVGVLKFLVAEGMGRPTDVGELNQTLADRLELALILTVDIQQPIGVIRNATAVAARTAGADHRTPEGRDKLFAARYPLAWGTEEVKADAFLTGVVRLEKDRSMAVNFFLVLPEAKNQSIASLKLWDVFGWSATDQRAAYLPGRSPADRSIRITGSVGYSRRFPTSMRRAQVGPAEVHSRSSSRRDDPAPEASGRPCRRPDGKRSSRSASARRPRRTAPDPWPPPPPRAV